MGVQAPPPASFNEKSTIDTTVGNFPPPILSSTQNNLESVPMNNEISVIQAREYLSQRLMGSQVNIPSPKEQEIVPKSQPKIESQDHNTWRDIEQKTQPRTAAEKTVVAEKTKNVTTQDLMQDNTEPEPSEILITRLKSPDAIPEDEVNYSPDAPQKRSSTRLTAKTQPEPKSLSDSETESDDQNEKSVSDNDAMETDQNEPSVSKTPKKSTSTLEKKATPGQAEQKTKEELTAKGNVYCSFRYAKGVDFAKFDTNHWCDLNPMKRKKDVTVVYEYPYFYLNRNNSTVKIDARDVTYSTYGMTKKKTMKFK